MLFTMHSLHALSQAPLLPLPMRNMAVVGGQATHSGKAGPPGLSGLTQGLVLTNDAATDTAQARWVHRASGWIAPPFSTTRIGPAPVRPAAAGGSASGAALPQVPAASGTPGAGATGFGSVFGGPATQLGERAPMQTSLFNQRNMVTAGGNEDINGFGSAAPAASGASAGRSLFSLGGGDAAQVQQGGAGVGGNAGPSRGMFSFSVRKKPRTEDWQS
jgi:hypothetical protein